MSKLLLRMLKKWTNVDYCLEIEVAKDGKNAAFPEKIWKGKKKLGPRPENLWNVSSNKCLSKNFQSLHDSRLSIASYHPVGFRIFVGICDQDWIKDALRKSFLRRTHFLFLFFFLILAIFVRKLFEIWIKKSYFFILF